MRSRAACKTYCWVLCPAAKAAARIAAPSSFGGRSIIASHFACAFFTARFCASVLAILSPLSGIIFCVLQNVAWLAMEHSTNT
nr:MAG TPA: hypothetical protein [Caudoviricetes sp.]